MTEHRRFDLPDDLTREEERALLAALERYFREESPHPAPWVLAGRMDATGLGWLQARKLAETTWSRSTRAPFVRRGVSPLHGRGDAS